MTSCGVWVDVSAKRCVCAAGELETDCFSAKVTVSFPVASQHQSRDVSARVLVEEPEKYHRYQVESAGLYTSHW